MQMPRRFPARSLLIATAFLALAACKRPDAAAQSRTITLESDPPGCEVYLDGTSLGRSPCVLSESRLHELGLNWPEYVHIDNALRMNWELDATGILIEPGQGGSASRKLFFTLPESRFSEFQAADTPWGKMAFSRELDRDNSDDNHWSYRFHCLFARTAEGLSMAIAIPDSAKPGEKCHLTLVCRNNSGQSFACFRPQVEVYCSKLDEIALQQSTSKTALPDSWCFFKAGEKNTASFDFTAPDAAGDYCVFAIVTLHQEPEGEKIYEAVYSNGKLLRVQQ